MKLHGPRLEFPVAQQVRLILAQVGLIQLDRRSMEILTALAIPDGRGNLVIFANNASLLTLQGITAAQAGQRLTICSVGAGQVDIANQNGSASAANRIINQVTGTISLAAGYGRVTMVYDGTNSRWRVEAHEQGAFISVTYTSTDYIGNQTGAADWTVASGDVGDYAYLLRGRELTLIWEINASSVANLPTALRILVPNGMTWSRNTYNSAHYVENGTYGQGLASGTTPFPNHLQLWKTDQTVAWANATNATFVRGELTGQVS
jgi:hypothetical protein